MMLQFLKRDFKISNSARLVALVLLSSTTAFAQIQNLQSLNVVQNVPVTATASATALCVGETINLSATSVATCEVSLLDENFNAATIPSGWKTTNDSNYGEEYKAAWTLRNSNYSTTVENFINNDQSKFFLSDSWAQGGSTYAVTRTTLSSPDFSTVGLSAASFSFYHFYKNFDYTDRAKVQISINGGSEWITLITYTSPQGMAGAGTQGANNAFALQTIDLSPYLNNAKVSIRFKYEATHDWYWAVDNVKVKGTTTAGNSTYTWSSSPVGFSSTLQNPTAVTPLVSTVYTVKVTNSKGCVSSASTKKVEVNPKSIGGLISGASSICAGSTSGLLTLSGHVGTVVRWEKSVSPFENWTPIENTTSKYTSQAISQTTKFRAVVKSGQCAAVTSAEIKIENKSTIWNGISWLNGEPTLLSAAIIEADFTSSSTITACSLVVKNNANVIINTNHSVVLEGALKVEAGSNFTLENNANLLQKGRENLNEGTISVKRFSSALKRQDYTLWSAPTKGGQSLQDFSPATLSNRFYTYNTATDLYAAIAQPATTNFDVAKGYLIRVPNTHPAVPTVWEQGSFIGTPNSGDYSFSLIDHGTNKYFNLVGNPYPSPINAVAFVKDPTNASNITGALYFWRKTNDSSKPTYSTWTTLGFNTNGVFNATGIVNPESIIQTGQGFFVEAKQNATTLKFNNTMRVDNHADQFFRTNNVTEKHRIWLNATNSAGLFSQTLLGYAADASNGVDASDGKFINDGAIALTSMIDETAYAIQGRSLPFDINDSVPLQFKTTTAGTFDISIDHVDGLFDGSQAIYLRDALTGVEHDLKLSSYSFVTEAGTFSNRFYVVYAAALSTNNSALNSNAVVIYKNENQQFVINSGNSTIDNVKVFDISGRLLLSQHAINANQTIVTVGQSNEIVLVKITSIDGTTVTKKVVR